MFLQGLPTGLIALLVPLVRGDEMHAGGARPLAFAVMLVVMLGGGVAALAADGRGFGITARGVRG
jgi:hypothetical protein